MCHCCYNAQPSDSWYSRGSTPEQAPRMTTDSWRTTRALQRKWNVKESAGKEIEVVWTWDEKHIMFGNVVMERKPKARAAMDGYD